MYKCDKCQGQVPSGAKVRRVTVETRERTYRVKRKVGYAQSKSKDRELPFQIEEHAGWEIASEMSVCDSCHRELLAVPLAARHELAAAAS